MERILEASRERGLHVDWSSSAAAGAVVASIESGGGSLGDGSSPCNIGEVGVLRFRRCLCTSSMLSNLGTAGSEGVAVGEEMRVEPFEMCESARGEYDGSEP